MVVVFLKERRDFYRHSQDENAFRSQICLGISPNSNAEKVKEYWKSKVQDISIDLRNHSDDYFWCEEQGYSKAELKEIEEEEKKRKEKENAC